MMKAVFFVGLVLSVLLVSGQNKKAFKIYEKGLIAFEKNDLDAANSLLSESANMFPCGDVYYNLALVNMKLEDTCAACNFYHKAMGYGDSESGKSYASICLFKDTVKYLNNSDSLFEYYGVKTTYKYADSSRFDFYRKSLNEKSPRLLILNSGLKTNENDFFSQQYPVENYITKEIFLECDEKPQFPGGEEAFMRFLCEKIRYPQCAKESNIQGTVYVQFVIECDGSISGIKILKGIGGGCDEETIRVVKLMPKWMPGKNNGQPVNVFFNLPIKFILQG